MDLFPIERKFIQPMLLARELCFFYRWCSTHLRLRSAPRVLAPRANQ